MTAIEAFKEVENCLSPISIKTFYVFFLNITEGSTFSEIQKMIYQMLRFDISSSVRTITAK